MFDRSTGRPLCVGNGETCRRVTANGMKTMPCPSPEACEIGNSGHCKPLGRLTVIVEGSGDETGSFIFRTTGFNSIRSLAARLNYFRAATGGHLATLPLELKLREKSTTLSRKTPIYFVDLSIRSGTTLIEAIRTSRDESQARAQAGFDQQALDQSARLGFNAGEFDDNCEDGKTVLEEFYNDALEVTSPSVRMILPRRKKTLYQN